MRYNRPTMINPHWQQFLESQNARIDGTTVQDFGNLNDELQAALHANWLADLSHFSTIKINGDKTLEFLQGQLTCDVKELKERQATLAACCNPKGRIIANFYMWREQNDYYLLLPQAMVTPTIEHLKKYAIFSKVAVAASADNLIVSGVAGELSKEQKNCATTILIPNPQSLLPTTHLIIADPETMISLWKNAQPHTTPIGALAWHAFNIKNGLSFIYPPTRELFTPQMINLQKLGGVSFSKGCYVGQEIIARTEHLGKLKRHLYHAHSDSDAPPQPGDELKNTAAQTVGIVVAAAPAQNSGFELLAVMQDQMLQQDNNIFYKNVNKLVF